MNRNRSTLNNTIKKEIMRAITHYLLKFLGKYRHKSYVHERIYQAIRRYLHQKMC
ncbi:hypothetical protein ACGTJS_10485 [Faucicola mancuniensis]|uniref:hypothetical protein n=1 Tax=Faucicola mancuniensis TaxID=1309795 RepID=UPI0028F08705|nr:hypothetical protein [uncultured Moraxella sp.]